MELSEPRRLLLGIVAVVLLAGLCVFAVSSVRGRLSVPASVATAPEGGSQALLAENARLRAEVARLSAERDAALARATASPVPPLGEGAAPPQAAPPAAPVPTTPVRHRTAAPSGSSGFVEPQTFESVSTH